MKDHLKDSFNIDELLTKVERRKEQKELTKGMKSKKSKKNNKGTSNYIY